MARFASLSDLAEVAISANAFPLIEFSRKPLDPHPLRGFALAWNGDLTLIQVFENGQFRLNGYTVFRNSDVKRFRPIENGEFWARAARLHRLRPALPRGVSISSVGEVLASAGAAFPLITVHRERIKRDVCHIGNFLGVNRRSVTVLDIALDAEWGTTERYLLKDITRIDFGGAYERIFGKLAKPLP